MALARLEKRLTEAEAPNMASKPVPPPPPPSAELLHVPTSPPAVRLYNMAPLGMPTGVPLPRLASSDQAETTHLRQFKVGEGSGA